ncbi:MAG: aminotransferase class III-fold pyridoxal phosphate-dependent enzyme [Myxococcales bacterium]|nr:aminotransferase class III-fold pyridoxal phosphate-dependent enzyme [Myxococcales bacterium]
MTSSLERIRGRVLAPDPHTPRLVDWPDALIEIDARGRITDVRAAPADCEVPETWPGAVVLPGFVDCHLHYPQTRIIGSASGPLLPWLERSVFPEEARFADDAHAVAVADEFCAAMIAQGTTSAGVFSSSHPSATQILLEALDRAGLRAVTGVTLMDREAPDAVTLGADAALAALEGLLDRHHGEVAGVVIEPLVQGAAGMIVSPPGFLRGVRELCDGANALLICDEVATGFGRTGRMFACEHEGVSPDLMAVAKGITGGYLPLAATLATEDLYEGFLANYQDMKHFFHGHTYTANPVAAAVAIANLDLFETDRTLERLQPKIERLAKGLERFRAHPNVGDVRQKGFMVGIELVRDRATKEAHPPEEKICIRVTDEARRRGVIIRPLAPALVLMPPLAITDEELDFLLDVTYASVEAVLGT